MKVLEDYLKENSESVPNKPAIVCNDVAVTYSELWNRVLARSKELTSDSQKIILLRATQSIEFLIEYFAIHYAGKVIVPLEKDLPEDSFFNIKENLRNYTPPADVTDILYTTGTTGKQKGTMLSRQAIIANAENLIYAQQFCHDITFIISGPLNHIGSLSKVWPVIIVGGTLVITEGMKNLGTFFHALDYPCCKIATFLVPASIRMLLQFSEERFMKYASKIDFIETGAAPISKGDMETLCKLLPNSRLYNTYASTETGIICTHDYNSGYLVEGCLGKTMKHSSIYISEDGAIFCSGKTLMSGYANDEELTRKVLRDGRIYTTDRGYIDSEGRLRLSGRNDDIINLGGYKVNPIEVESAALSFPDISDCICIADKHPVLGIVLRLLVVMQEGQVLNKKQLAHFLMDKLERYKIPQLYSSVDSVERTYNGKLNRKFYKTRLE